MLVLSRKENETIVLPDLNITIRVSEISGRRVRLAVEAPREIQVLRQEVAHRCQPISQVSKAQSRSGEHCALMK
jgi:carbon storage regulator